MDVSSQNYKVFFNNVLLEFVEVTVEENEMFEGGNLLFEEAISVGNWSRWLSLKEERSFVVQCLGVEDVFAQFLSYFKIVEAAGGLVTNEQDNLLSIFRNETWDLPKGKLEINEDIKECAIREVEEETCVSVSDCSEQKFAISYHVYFHKKTYVLKPTTWYLMKSVTNDEKLKPQLEEGIDKVEWVERDRILPLFSENSFRSIRFLISKYLSLQ